MSLNRELLEFQINAATTESDREHFQGLLDCLGKQQTFNDFLKDVISNNSGGIKFTDLLVQIVLAVRANRLAYFGGTSLKQPDVDRMLTEIKAAGFSVLVYGTESPYDVRGILREKYFIYTG